MGTITVLRFTTDHGAWDAIETIRDLQRRHVLTLRDAAIVTWPSGKKSPRMAERVDLVASGGFGGVFWGMLFGLIFFTPFFGLCVGVAIGTLGGILGDYKVDDTFIGSVRCAITEGTSALFLITDDAIADGLAAAMPGQTFDVVSTRLSTTQERRLREAFIHH